ncbi:MAG: cytochrome c biogenesis protein CcsA [Chloroflexota bacterium]|nr:cytochrome c biogenesis protein CcsA [Chloroflexota bacterium]
MVTLAPALLVAALLSLVGAIAIGVGSAVWIELRPAVAASGASLRQPGDTTSLASTITSALILGLILLIAALVLRALATGHAPWSNMYEFNQAFAAVILAGYLGLERRLPIRSLAPLVALPAAGLLAYSLTLPAEVVPLPPALQTPFFLTVHVGSAMLAYGIAAIAGAAAVGELVQRWRGDRLAWLPRAAICRAAAYRSVLLGMPVLTLAIVLGAAWANLAWRSYWNNDPKELAAAATWFVYAAYLHLGGRRDGWGSGAAWFLVAGFGAVLFTYLAANLVIPGQHSYSGV